MTAFLDQFSQNIQTRRWSGINLSAAAYSIVNGIQQNGNTGPVWILCATEAKAEAMYQSLCFFRDFFRIQTDVVSYPEDDPRSFDGASPPPNVPRQRIIALQALKNKNTIVVSSALAVLHKSLSADDLESLLLSLKVNEEYPRAELLSAFQSLGYLNSELREEGMITHRGDTIQIWPNGEKNPYRLSFFDDELEAIEELNPTTGKIHGSKTRIDILPVKEAVLNSQSLHRCIRSIRKWAQEKQTDRTRVRSISRDLSEQLWFPGAEDYLPVLWSIESPLERANFHILFEPKDVEEQLFFWSEQLEKRWSHLQAEEHPLVDSRLRFSQAEEIMQQLRNPLGISEFQADSLSFSVESVPHQKISFTNITALRQTLKDWLEDDWRIAIVCHSLHQQSQLKMLLADHYITIHTCEYFDQPHNKAVLLCRGELSEGYIEPSSRTAFLSARELFSKQPTHRKKTLREATVLSYTDLKIGDYVVHRTHGIGRFIRLASMVLKGEQIECLEIEYQNEATILVPFTRMQQLFRYRSNSKNPPRMDKLGGKSWKKKVEKVKTKVLEMAHELIRIHAKRAAAKGYAYTGESSLLQQVTLSFPYEETPDQSIAISEILSDLSSIQPMNRLLIGDVGFGKTEVAIRAAARVVSEGHQVALLCPTTILALQHYRTFEQRFQKLNIRTALVSRLQSPSQIKKIHEGVRKGEIHILIGTQALLNKRLRFQQLGLVVVDEEHRFGVVQKEKIKTLSQENPSFPADYLAMSATPIPRTLHMALSGIRSVSILATPPAGRQPVHTLTIHQSETKIQHQIRRELQRGGQLFFVHNRVQSLDSCVSYLKTLVPEAKICAAHGQMNKKELETTMLAFMRKEYNLLVCTSIIENGVDFPSANTIFIDNAHQLGLAQLYQLRGRVGRSSLKAYCTFIVPKTGLKRTALARLNTLQRFTDLASGFAIASADLELRGSGNLLGKEQSGHIEAVGLDMYIELLEKSIRELQGKQSLEHFDPDVQLPVSASLPNSYIPDTQERLYEYQKLASVFNITDLRSLLGSWEASYGEAPQEVLHLAWCTEARIWCRILGIEKLHWLKSRVLLLMHPQNPLQVDIVQEICQRHPTRLHKKEKKDVWELSAYFTQQEKEDVFPFLFWIFQELQKAVTR
ncbi:MAG: transcription-repair coupling factor [Myxococcota bacterium]|nr:transcription-repair coupling factor [Myxococcota bacterium]